MIPRPYTSKQMEDACEMPVEAELTLAGIPAMKMPDNWPCYDVNRCDEGTRVKPSAPNCLCNNQHDDCKRELARAQ
jgi:hypothetical protein